jgi:hypothetical protein
LQVRKKCVKNGKSTLVWKDICLYNDPFCILAPDLFKLCDQKDISVFQLVSGEVPISFCRFDQRDEWNKIKENIFDTLLLFDQDTVSWKLECRDNFSVKSTYNALTCYSPESANHLLFDCFATKVVWATVATCLGATNIPTSFEQSWRWCKRWVPRENQFYVVGIVAICWSI